VAAAAEAAGVADFLRTLPAGLDTPVNEGAQNLSGGQRQRIAIARALLTGAPILILDEPTSALDPRHERHILNTLEQLRQARTIILVTHRIESVAACDHIFVMNQGRLVEEGNHASLLALHGLYFSMAVQETDGDEESLDGRLCGPSAKQQ
jgi:subfamily B ATP-binding cassette protein MsbA